MILTCPACGTQYVVKDGAIPPGGRKVRCASCRHSWHQDPEPLDLSSDAEVGPDEAVPAGEDVPAEVAFAHEPGPDAGAETQPADDHPTATEEAIAEPAADELGESVPTDEPGPEVEPVPFAPAGDEGPFGPPAEEDEFSPFARREVAAESRPRPWLRLLALLILVAALAAAFWFFAPTEWKARVGLAAAQDTPLQLMMTHSDRQRLASGNELLAVSGRVINPTDRRQTVPPITAELRSGNGQLVYSWTIAPPARSLEPGASATFNSAQVDVPAGGDQLTVSLGGPSA